MTTPAQPRLPLFDSALLKNMLASFGTNIEAIIESRATQFIKGNEADAVALGDDVVDSILKLQVFELIDVQDAQPEDSMELKAIIAAQLRQRSAAQAVIANAQRTHSEAVARVKANAIGFAGGLVKEILGLGSKLLVG